MNNSTSRLYTFDKVVRLIITTIVIIGAVWLIDYLKSVLLPFLVACLIAYIIHPFILYNKKALKLKGNVMPTVVSLFEIICLLTVLLIFFIPYITSEIGAMATMFQQYAKANVDIPFLPAEIHNYIIKYLNFDSLYNMFSHEEIMTFVEEAIAEMWTIMGSSVRVVLAVCSWAIVLLYLVFILIDYDKIMGGFKAMIPAKYSVSATQIFKEVESSMNHYFRGQALISFIVGVLFSIGFLIVGLPLAVIFGLFIGLLNMVPYLQLISIPMAALLCLVNSVSTGENFWLLFGETFAVYCVVQAIQDMYLTPKIMGKYMGLNPAIIFLSLSIWGTLLGFIGLIIALPLTSLVISYYDRYIIHAKESVEVKIDDNSDSNENV
ncbi:MAG: AI-2E family transporter [Muribaculaceae bacterium]|nr:AI-2E family transporter [Muribaculaceae bacterium]